MFLFKANKLSPNVPIRLECLDENVDDILKNINTKNKKKIRKNRLNKHRLYKYNKEIFSLLVQVYNMNNLRFAALNAKIETILDSIKNDRDSFRQYMDIKGIRVQEEILSPIMEFEIPQNISYDSMDILKKFE